MNNYPHLTISNLTQTIFTALLFALAFAEGAYAVDGDLDATFSPNVGIEGDNIQAIAVQDDGNILVGGFFASVDGETLSNLARFTPDGELDEDFAMVALDSIVQAITLQADGKILLAGEFSTVNDIERNLIARLNPNGELDTSFNPNVTGDNVRTIALQIEQGVQRILIGGEFSAVGNILRNNIARLNTNGTVDAGFDPNADDQVRTIFITRNNQILVGGDFNNVSDVTRDNIARLNTDGSLDTNFTPLPLAFMIDGVIPVMLDGFIQTVGEQADGKILIAGEFNMVGETARISIARLNPNDGSLDESFDLLPSTNFSIPNFLNLIVQPDDKVLIAGLFSNRTIATDDGPMPVEGTFNLARLSSDGSLDSSFTPSVLRLVTSMALQPADGNILIGGAFASVGGETRNRVARLENDLSAQISFTLSNQQLNLTEGNQGERLFNFSVSRIFNTDGESTVNYLVSGSGDNPATADDFADGVFAQQGTATFADGQANQTISIAVAGDLVEEPDQAFNLTLSPGDAALGQRVMLQGTILDDDNVLCLPIPANNDNIAVICL